MENIDLDAKHWRSIDDFYRDIKLALGAPSWHGNNINALVDSVAYGGINEVNPPFQVAISNVSKTRDDIANHIRLAAGDIVDAIKQEGKSDQISFQVFD